MGVENNTSLPIINRKIYRAVRLAFWHIRPGFFMQKVSGVHSVEIREMDQIFVPAETAGHVIDAAILGCPLQPCFTMASYKNTATR
jgi:hypothetical protein